MYLLLSEVVAAMTTLPSSILHGTRACLSVWEVDVFMAVSMAFWITVTALSRFLFLNFLFQDREYYLDITIKYIEPAIHVTCYDCSVGGGGVFFVSMPVFLKLIQYLHVILCTLLLLSGSLLTITTLSPEPEVVGLKKHGTHFFSLPLLVFLQTEWWNFHKGLWYLVLKGCIVASLV
jgi:hypothetical protein